MRESGQTVGWYVVGPAGDVVDIELVTIRGTRAETVAVLATEVATEVTHHRVAVPAVAPGRYHVLVTSARGVLDAYSGTVVVTAV